MIEERISEETLQDLQRFQNFLYRNFFNYDQGVW